MVFSISNRFLLLSAEAWGRAGRERNAETEHTRVLHATRTLRTPAQTCMTYTERAKRDAPSSMPHFNFHTGTVEQAIALVRRGGG